MGLGARIGIAGVALALLAPSSALAGNASADVSGRVTFDALPGETNNLIYDYDGTNWSLSDSMPQGAPSAGAGCTTAGSPTKCVGGNAATFNLGDGNDSLPYVSPVEPLGPLDISVFGGAGVDDLRGTTDGGRRLLDGGEGDDALSLGIHIPIGGARALPGNYRLQGAAGNDSLVATEPHSGTIAVAMDGGTGNDRLLGGAGVDELTAGEGDDHLDGGRGGDRYTGGGGRDSLFSREFNDPDLVDCGAGADKVLGDRPDLIGPSCERVGHWFGALCPRGDCTLTITMSARMGKESQVVGRTRLKLEKNEHAVPTIRVSGKVRRAVAKQGKLRVQLLKVRDVAGDSKVTRERHSLTLSAK